MEDFDVDDIECPACGHHVTHSRHCGNFACNDGICDMYEDDPINYSPGEWESCEDCCGTGIERWCPKCGKDYWRAKAAQSEAK